MKNPDMVHFKNTQGENIASCGYSGVCVPFKSRRHIKLSKPGNTSTRVEINAKEGSHRKTTKLSYDALFEKAGWCRNF